MSFSGSERNALANLLEEKGPDAPTLCDGWTTHDLAAHLVARENRPDAILGKLLFNKAERNDEIEAEFARQPFEVLVDKFRGGAPKWSPMNWADRYINMAEYFVHLEDVRRAEPGWEPRELPPSAHKELWQLLKLTAPRMLGKSTKTVVMMRTDGAALTAHDSHSGDSVTIRGDVGELVLWLYGRDGTRVEVDGDMTGVHRTEL
ncbi:TIGR03085 family metal-binding protein [Corynebacterium ulceribovis]|uniref:TIGR03085 family metal-binding protein n=1 Tax=Corynebacterium ulceribovis TaxID=487732 RepID=UPI00037F886E|nr:TIGR03085 family metal-binding protein [Corynebacterium ulceribovis]